MVDARLDAALLLSASAFTAPLASVAQQSQRKVPRIGFLISELLAEQANRIEALQIGLLGYGANNAGLYRRGAYFVDRVLKGAKPVEQPMRFELAVNLKTAKALGLRMPPEMLERIENRVRAIHRCRATICS